MTKSIILCAVFILICLIFTTNIYAESIILDEPTIVGDNIRITGITPSANAMVIVTVTKRGETPANTKAVYFSKQIDSGTDGVFNFDFTMSKIDRLTGEKLMSGEFTIYARSTDSDLVQVGFVYVSTSSKEIALEYINSKKLDSQKLHSFLIDEKNRLVLDNLGTLINYYLEMPNYLQINTCKVLSHINDDFDENSWRTQANNVIAAMIVNSADDLNSIAQVLENNEIRSRVDLKFDGVEYEAIEDEIKTFFKEMLLNSSNKDMFENINELELLYKQAMVLYKLNNTNYSLIFDNVLNPYVDILNFADNSDYLYLVSSSASTQNAVLKDVKKSGVTFKNIDEFASSLKSAVKYVKDELSKRGIGNSVGSSGSVSKTSESPITVTASQNKNGAERADSENSSFYTDISSVPWANDGINTLTKNNIITGVGEGRFEPNRNVTRAEFIKMIIGALSLMDKNANCDFEDVNFEEWSYPYIASAQKLGITNGVGEKVFGVNQQITRQEMAVFAHRAAIRAYLPITDEVTDEPFDDEGLINDWALRSVYLMRGAGIINGKGNNTFEPISVATRAEAVKIIYELYKFIQP